MMPRYGQKGGDGPTAGKKARKFTCSHPDGDSPQVKRSFHFPEDGQPAAGWYRHNNTWYLQGVFDRRDPPSWIGKDHAVTEAEETH